MTEPLADFLARGEGPTLEFKRRLDAPGKISKTLAAFANTAGGTLVVGVNDDGTLRGVANETTQTELLDEAARFWVEPPLALRYETVYAAGRKILLARVPESEEKPHRAKNQRGTWEWYVRVGAESVPAGKQMATWLERGTETDAKLLESPNVKQLFRYLRQHGRVTPKQFAKLVNRSEQFAEKLLRELARQGVLLFLETQSPKTYALRGEGV
jgi:predicted HTH transcriptional regulator